MSSKSPHGMSNKKVSKMKTKTKKRKASSSLTSSQTTSSSSSSLPLSPLPLPVPLPVPSTPLTSETNNHGVDTNKKNKSGKYRMKVNIRVPNPNSPNPNNPNNLNPNTTPKITKKLKQQLYEQVPFYPRKERYKPNTVLKLYQKYARQTIQNVNKKFNEEVSDGDGDGDGDDDNKDNNNDDNNNDDNSDNSDENRGWILEDLLKMDEHDISQEEFGINFLEEGYKNHKPFAFAESADMGFMIHHLLASANGTGTGSHTTTNTTSASASASTSTNTNTNIGSADVGNKHESAYYEKQYAETRMWHVPNVPPSKKLLQFLLRCSTNKLNSSLDNAKKEAMLYETTLKKRNENHCYLHDYSSSSSSDDDDDSDSSFDSLGLGFNLTNNHESNICNLYDDFELKKKNKITKGKSTKADITSTTATATATASTTIDESLKEKYNNIKKLYQSSDETALVAIGMMVEECMTATFLPLAAKHVTRCRMLESMQTHNERWCNNKRQRNNNNNNNDDDDDQSNNDNDNDYDKKSKDPFIQWTLPPAEAIAQLCHRFKLNKEQKSASTSTSANTDYNHAYLPSSSYVHSSSHNSNEPRSSNLSSKLWCKHHGFDMNFVIDNPDLFEQFIHNPDPKLSECKRKRKQYDLDVKDIKRALAKAMNNGIVMEEENGSSDCSSNSNSETYWPIPEIRTHSVSNDPTAREKMENV